MMELYKRTLTSNIYEIGRTKKKINRLACIGGANCNVPKDRNNNLVPLDNRLIELVNHPFAAYGIRQGHCKVGFHGKVNNKYGCIVKLYTGESVVKRAIGDTVCTPSVIDDRIIQWKYGNGSWIREYFTEKHIKEIMYQKAGQVIKFEYSFNGLTVKKAGNKFEVYRGKKIAFTLSRPYYCKQNGDFISYVPISWQKVNDKWQVTYPAPSVNKYIDPILTFGEGVGQIGGDHKDGTIRSDLPNFALGGDAELQADSNQIMEFLMRFSLVGHIPIDAVLNDALFRIYSNRICPANLQMTISRMITDWGITLVDEGISQNPGLLGQGTWNNAFSHIIPTPWAGGAAITAADYGAPIFTFNCANGDPAGTLYTVDITGGVALDILDDLTQYGYHFESDNIGFFSFRSQNHANAATRPSLQVDFDYYVPPEPPPLIGNGRQSIKQYKIFNRSF